MKFPTGGKVHELFLLKNNMNWCNSSTDSYSLDGRSEKLIFNINLLNSFIVYSFNIYIKYKIIIIIN